MKLFRTYSEEGTLIRDCAKGKSSAQEKLYRMYARKMYGVSLRYSRNKEEAEDILQESFIKIFRSLKNFKGAGSLEGWIRRIVVNTALEQHRRQSRMVPVVEINEALDEDSGVDLISSINRDEILRQVRALPKGYRTVLNLYAIEGFSHKEIADELGISVGTSKSQLARARELLRTNIQKLSKENYGTEQ